MKNFSKIVLIPFLLVFFSSAWATKTKIDLTIYESDLVKAGIRNVDKIKSDLKIKDKSDGMMIVHAVSTGAGNANRQFQILDINTLEQITPKIDSAKIIEDTKQVELSMQQVESLTSLLKRKNQNVPKWLMNGKEKKYIHVILVNKKEMSARKPIHAMSALSTADAKKLVSWAVHEKQLYAEDHPTTMNSNVADHKKASALKKVKQERPAAPKTDSNNSSWD